MTDCMRLKGKLRIAKARGLRRDPCQAAEIKRLLDCLGGGGTYARCDHACGRTRTRDTRSGYLVEMWHWNLYPFSTLISKEGFFSSDP